MLKIESECIAELSTVVAASLLAGCLDGTRVLSVWELRAAFHAPLRGSRYDYAQCAVLHSATHSSSSTLVYTKDACQLRLEQL